MKAKTIRYMQSAYALLGQLAYTSKHYLRKKMKINNKIQHILLLMLYLSTNYIQAELSDLIHTNPWEMMHDKFITRPYANASEVLPIIAKSALSLGIGTGVYYAANMAYEQYKTSDYYTPGFDNNLYDEFEVNGLDPILLCYLRILLPIGSGCLVYYKLHTAFVAHYQYKQLVDLLDNFTDLKPRIPAALQPRFEELHQRYQKNPKELYYKANDIIRGITQQINENCNGKAHGKFWNANWNAKLLTGNIISDIASKINSFTRIFKK